MVSRLGTFLGNASSPLHLDYSMHRQSTFESVMPTLKNDGAEKISDLIS